MADETGVKSTELLKTLDRKKQALEEVMHVTQTVERLQQGLQAVLLMGKSAHGIPKQVLQFYRGLDARLRGQPVNELSGLLGGLEKAIHNDIGQILQLAVVDDAVLLERRDQDGDGDVDAMADVGRLAEDFRRRVQMAVYLRVLLREQGVATQPLEFAVPTEQIVQQIEALAERGRRCREKVQEQILSMLQDIQQCINSQALPEALKENLQSVQEELQANLKHLKAGKPVAEVPFEVDSFTLQEDQVEVPLEQTQTHRSGAEQPNTVKADDAAAVSAPRRPGLIRSLWAWCMTPPGVGWAEIRSGRYPLRRRRN